jgi:hypothetical protein
MTGSRALALGLLFVTSCESSSSPIDPTTSGGPPGSAPTPGISSGPGTGDGSGTGGQGGGTGGSGSPTSIGPTGGTVSLLHLGLTGDTRPASCTQIGQATQDYPTVVINSIADAFQTHAVDAVLDLGDHMYVCNNDIADAQTQMGLYMKAAARYKGTWFMTMGNHECSGTPCLPGSTSANYKAYMAALAPLSSTPYYRVDIHTSKGLVALVVIADNAWDTTQANWLKSTLSSTDTQATYTLVARHHPVGDSSVSTNSDSEQIVLSHKFALFLTGHSHEYKHTTTNGGRDVVLGIGGAPLIAGGAFHGYALVDQQPSGQLTVTVYDVTSNAAVDSWTVGPNQ